MYSRKRRRKLQFLITAGGTREYIDPVRFISNASSGKMGYCLARSALLAGHNVTLITAPTNLNAPKGAGVVKVESARDMFEAVKDKFGGCDCLIMTAAVSDYTPAKPARHKMKKSPGAITLKLKPTRDILKWAGTHKKQNQVVVGFALEDRDIKSRRRTQNAGKKAGYDYRQHARRDWQPDATVEIKSERSRWINIRRTAKSAIAHKIVRLTENLFVEQFQAGADLR